MKKIISKRLSFKDDKIFLENIYMLNKLKQNLECGPQLANPWSRQQRAYKNAMIFSCQKFYIKNKIPQKHLMLNFRWFKKFFTFMTS